MQVAWAVEGLAAAVVAHRRTRIGVAEGVWSDPLRDPGPPSDPEHDPPGGVAVETASIGLDEDRSA